MAERDDAYPAAGTQYAGLDQAETAAARVDLHMAGCDEPRLTDCPECVRRLATIRRVRDAVWPLAVAAGRRKAAADIRECTRSTVPGQLPVDWTVREWAARIAEGNPATDGGVVRSG